MGINRNIVECKGITDMDYRSGQHRINRNIVECKAVQHPEMLLQQNGINRNIVECKERRQQKQAGGSQMY